MLNIFALLDIFGIPFVIVIILGLVILIFEIWMFINAIKNKYIDSGRKALWIIGMLVIHPFVAIAYYFTDNKKSN